jgi:hypothetical protein
VLVWLEKGVFIFTYSSYSPAKAMMPLHEAVQVFSQSENVQASKTFKVKETTLLRQGF